MKKILFSIGAVAMLCLQGCVVVPEQGRYPQEVHYPPRYIYREPPPVMIVHPEPPPRVIVVPAPRDHGHYHDHDDRPPVVIVPTPVRPPVMTPKPVPMPAPVYGPKLPPKEDKPRQDPPGRVKVPEKEGDMRVRAM